MFIKRIMVLGRGLIFEPVLTSLPSTQRERRGEGEGGGGETDRQTETGNETIDFLVG